MLFNSPAYAVFLPIVFLLYWFVFNKNQRSQNLFIVLASFFFYGWCDWRFLFLISFTAACSFMAGLLIEKYRGDTGRARAISTLNIVINLLILGVFKYYDFFASSFAEAFLGGRSDRLLLHLALPVGISFYTFKALSYSIEVYRGKLEPTHDVVQFFAFVCFFPQLLAGPIDRATTLLPQFAKPRTFDYETGVEGMRQILWGLFKKVVVADNCALFVDQVFSNYQTQSGSTLFLAAIFFSFQIYGDFSGYSDMAIGSGKLLGIKMMRNFNVPYFSRNIAEFWRRWHISLTSWFRDYVYIPMGGSRCAKWKIVRNTFIVFLLSGLWHGANWTFIAWGAYHALLFLPLILMGKNRKYRDTVAEGKLLPSVWEFGQMLVTFVLVLFGWILFRSDSIGDAWVYFSRMIRWGTLRASYRFFTLPEIRFYAVSVLVMLGVEWIWRDGRHSLSVLLSRNKPVRWCFYVMCGLCVFLFRQDASAFIYFQF